MKGLSLSDTYKAEVGDARVHAVCSLWIELFDTRLDRQRVARERERECVCVCVSERERERETLLGIRLVSATLSPRAPFQGEEERSRDWMRVVQDSSRALSLSLYSVARPYRGMDTAATCPAPAPVTYAEGSAASKASRVPATWSARLAFLAISSSCASCMLFICARWHAHINEHIHARTHVCMNTHTHTHTHKHIQTHSNENDLRT